MRTRYTTVTPLWKATQLALTAFALFAAGMLSANFALAGEPGCPGRHGKMMSPEAFRERLDQRMTALHDKLKITAEQESAWQAFANVGRDRMMREMPDREAMAKLTAPERLERKIEMMDKHHEHMRSKLEALKTLYGQLSAEQQATLNAEFMNWRGRRGGKGPGAGPDGEAQAQ